MDRDLYEILHVSPDADAQSIRAAFRTLARRYHPDLTADPETAPRMAQLNAAFEVLGDLGRRAAYDQERREAAARATRERARREPPSAGAGGTPPGRPSGSVLPFGRYQGWSLGEIARVDPYYLAWLEGRREGSPYLEELGRLLRDLGFHRDGGGRGPRAGR